MEPDLISKGLELMLFGMGTVITFLTLLVFATSGMSALLARFAPPERRVLSTGAAAPPPSDARLLAVIAAAIHKYRSRP